MRESAYMYSESKPYFIRSAVLLLLVVSAFFLVQSDAIGAGGEVRLTSGSSDEFQPDIEGDKVVWLSGLNDPYVWAKFSAVYLHTLGGSTQKINAGTYSYGHQPAIGGSSVVWEDLRNDSGGGTLANTDIYGYALPGGPESGIAVGASDQQEPAVSGGRTVWQAFASGDSDIYLKDNDGQVYQITTNSSLQSDPRIDGDLIVWKDKRNDGGDVYAYDLSQGTYKQDPRPSPDPAETRITTNGAKQINPDVSGRKIVWTDYRSLIGSAYIYDLDNPVANGSPLDARATHQTGARISGNLVTWVDWRNGNYGDRTNSDIYAANSTSGQVIQITTNAAVQTSPAVSGLRIVWADRRNGHWDVYYKELAPTAGIKIKNGAAYTRTRSVTLNLWAADISGSSITQMRFKNQGGTWSGWESFKATKNWTMTSYKGSKRVYFQVKNGAGLVSGAVSDLIRYDPDKPVARMDAPFVSTKISKTTTFKVKWWATDPAPPTGIKSYFVYYRPSTSKTWRIWKNGTTATEGYFKGKVGVTYYFRTKAFDKAGNHDWSKVYTTTVPFNEGMAVYRRIGFNAFSKSVKARHFLGTLRSSYRKGHTVVYKLTRTKGIGLVTTKYKNRGRAKIYIDGRYVTTVDAHSRKFRPRQLIFYKGFAKKRTHYLKIVNLGTPGRSRFDLDAVVVKR